jgi:hypothetical protein
MPSHLKRAGYTGRAHAHRLEDGDLALVVADSLVRA